MYHQYVDELGEQEILIYFQDVSFLGEGVGVGQICALLYY